MLMVVFYEFRCYFVTVIEFQSTPGLKFKYPVSSEHWLWDCEEIYPRIMYTGNETL